MEAIILAGGFGTRLSHVVNNVPKPMAQVANHPFLVYILDYLKENGISHVVMATGYKSDVIEKYFGESYKSIFIDYSIENEPLGTGGAIKKAFKMCNNDNVFIINGDTYFDVSLNDILNQHNNKNSYLTIATKKLYKFDRYGSLSIDNNDKIISFNEKKYVDEGIINGGIYFCNKHLLDKINLAKFSFEKEILEKQVNEGRFYSLNSNEYFIDIGIPEDYYKACEDFK